MKFQRVETWQQTKARWAKEFNEIYKQCKAYAEKTNTLRLSATDVLEKMYRLSQNFGDFRDQLVEIYNKYNVPSDPEQEAKINNRFIIEMVKAYEKTHDIPAIAQEFNISPEIAEKYIANYKLTRWLKDYAATKDLNAVSAKYGISVGALQNLLAKRKAIQPLAEEYRNQMMQIAGNKIFEIESEIKRAAQAGSLQYSPDDIIDKLLNKYTNPQYYTKLLMGYNPYRSEFTTEITDYLNKMIKDDLGRAIKDVARESSKTDSLDKTTNEGSEDKSTTLEDSIADPNNPIERLEKVRSLLSQLENLWHSGRLPQSQEQLNDAVQQYYDLVSEYEQLTGSSYEVDPEIEVWKYSNIVPHVLANLDYPMTSDSHKGLRGLDGLYGVAMPHVKSRIRHPEDIFNPYESARDEQGNVTGSPNQDAIYGHLVVHNLLEVAGMYHRSKAKIEGISEGERDENKTIQKQFLNWKNRMYNSIDQNSAIQDKDTYKSEVDSVSFSQFLLMFNEMQSRGFLLGVADYERRNNPSFDHEGQPKSWGDFTPDDEDAMAKRIHEVYYPEGSSRGFRAYRQIPNSSLGYRPTSISVPEQDKQEVIRGILQNALMRGRSVKDFFGNNRKTGKGAIPSGRYELPYDHPYFRYTGKPSRKKQVQEANPVLEETPMEPLANTLKKLIRIANIIECEGFLTEAEEIDRIVDKYA